MSGMLSGTLLVRKIAAADPRRVRIGDVVVLKDPANPNNYLVRRVAAVEGHEMVSDNPDDDSFVLARDHCWVLADNKRLKPKEAYDSRTFGPVAMSCIVGRALYCLRNGVDHGPVHNSIFSRRQDSAVLEVELNVDEMTRNHKP
ncbi:uncharacterized protein LOC127258935 isoform X2 [Andrographis paniculata]|nr:uncharacterized protein LOC127258935 isoform X2 [Andrographis paniculata]